ncbi:MAG: hypothetical protein FWG58_04550 [Methanomassiliicoccaceae archaeon]|nr:hypothetical protein [Methanomassiliicoccaceae archaeon]
MNTERSLAHIEIITEIRPIPEKDRIVLAKVLGWNVVIGKDEFKVGDKVVYVEADSRLNTKLEMFSLLEKDADRFGFVHIKTRKFGDSYSQGICFRVPEQYVKLRAGSDLTKLMNKNREGKELAIVHNEEYKELKEEWSDPKPKAPKIGFLRRIYYRLFPRKRRNSGYGRVPDPYTIGVRKTDEERIQNMVDLFARLREKGTVLIATEKIDGQSFTSHIDEKGKIYVASRNVPMYFLHGKKVKRSGTYDGSNWRSVYEQYGLQDVLRKMHAGNGSSVTIQGEVIGTGIQGNHYKLMNEEKSLKVFNIVIDGKRLPFDEMAAICAKYELETVPPLGKVTLTADMTIENFIELSDGMSVVNKNVIREGIVYRTEDYALSFKAVSNRFLMKRGE